MTMTVVRSFLCVAQDYTSSKMFTVGCSYPVHQLGFPSCSAGYVTDDLGHLRYIPPAPHEFIVENNSALGHTDVRRARFKPITETLP